MVTSTRQIIANRENAKKGGVKTEEGKSISRFNAVKHGIFSDVTIASGEDKEIFDQLRDQMFYELKPRRVLEDILVDRIVVFVWRLRRCTMADRAGIECQYRNYKPKDGSVEINFSSFAISVFYNHYIELLLRYETTFEKCLYNVMRELKDLQRKRLESEQKTLLELDFKANEE